MMMKRFKRRPSNDFLLREQEEDADAAPYTPPPERILQTPDSSDTLIEKEASVDQKIDRYLMQFEKESVPLEQPGQGAAVGAPTDVAPLSEGLFRFLFEQEAPPDDLGDMGGGGDDLGGGADDFDMGGGDEDSGGDKESAEPREVPVPRINIRRFAEGVARLVNNYQTLVDPKTLILNRAMYYISKNYSARLAKEMMGILERDFDLTPKTPAEVQASSPPAPRAGGSGPDNGGGVPSGGSIGSSSGS